MLGATPRNKNKEAEGEAMRPKPKSVKVFRVLTVTYFSRGHKGVLLP